MKNEWDKVISDWDKLTNPAALSFVPKIKKSRNIKRTDYRRRFSNTRYNIVDSGGAFLSPVEELNYTLNQDLYGERVRA